MLIKNGMLHTVARKEPFVGDILIEGGRIAAIGPNLSAGDGGELDAAGLHVFPGMVEAHCHLGLEGYGIGFEGTDYNEMNDSLTPQLRGIDGFYPQNETVRQAALGGVTTVATGPGSANVLGGTFAAIKMRGTRVDDMVLHPAVAMKCAFGENPKRVYRDKSNYSRMTTAAKLRAMLRKAQEYKAKLEAAGDDLSKRPAYDEKLEALVPVIEGKLPLKAHAHRADDIFTAIRVAREFGARLTIEHCTDGHLIAGELAAEGIPVAVGPTLMHATKYEVRNKTFETPGILARAGCQVSIITDSPVIPQQYLPLCAEMAVKAGMDPCDALKAVTINPARHLGIEARVGSLEVGKDADIVIADGDILCASTNVLHTYIDGVEIARD